MNRIFADDHPDCWIDCKDSGNAVYVDPPGVCLAQCGEGSLVKKLGEVARIASLVAQAPTISIGGEAERDRLLSLSVEYDHFRESGATYAETFGSISFIVSVVYRFPSIARFTYSYTGPASHFSKGIAKSLQPKKSGEERKW